MSAQYAELEKHWKKIEVLKSTMSLLHWDLETYMPVGSIGLRQDQLSQAVQLEYEWLNESKFKELVLSSDVSPQSPREKRNLALWKKTVLVNSSVDAAFLDRYTRATSECNIKWRGAKERSNFSEIKELFKEVVNLGREQLQRIRENKDLKSYYDGKSLYEVAFDQFEPGFPLSEMQSLLTNLCEGTKKRLPAYLEKNSKMAAPTPINGEVVNKEFCENLMRSIGFDFSKGRLDSSTHPFCGGYTGDIRLTVRTPSLAKNPTRGKDPLEDLLSTLHEVGHALYEQGLPAASAFEPSGKACSMGVHESQSRFIENIIGRSRAFCEFLAPQLSSNTENIYTMLNPVRLGFIRVDSDEVTYNLHILLRFELERDLMEGRLEVKDLPEAWNSRFFELTGLKVENDGMGCLQDTHWYSGAFGYFPSYSLGNMFSAELFQDFNALFPDWSARVKKGELKFIRDFMSEKVYSQAALYDSPECMQKIIGRKVSEVALLKYFDQKFA